jgi:hypothetical protein
MKVMLLYKKSCIIEIITNLESIIGIKPKYFNPLEN